MIKIMKDENLWYLEFINVVEDNKNMIPKRSITKLKKAEHTSVNQKDLIYNILLNGNAFTELELTKAITNNNERGARSFIAILRREGCPIASRNVINRYTGRLNKAYYWEHNESKYIQWCLNNGYFEFKKGAPK
jgi:hypothetical protein